jgi:hypothetical protein
LIFGPKNLAAYHALNELYKLFVGDIFANAIVQLGMGRLNFFTRTGTTCPNVRAIVLFLASASVLASSFATTGSSFFGSVLTVHVFIAQVLVDHVPVRLLISLVFDHSFGASAFGILTILIIFPGRSAKNACQPVDHRYAHHVPSNKSAPNIFEIICFHVVLNPCVSHATIR